MQRSGSGKMVSASEITTASTGRGGDQVCALPSSNDTFAQPARCARARARASISPERSTPTMRDAGSRRAWKWRVAIAGPQPSSTSVPPGGTSSAAAAAR